MIKLEVYKKHITTKDGKSFTKYTTNVYDEDGVTILEVNLKARKDSGFDFNVIEHHGILTIDPENVSITNYLRPVTNKQGKTLYPTVWIRGKAESYQELLDIPSQKQFAIKEELPF